MGRWILIPTLALIAPLGAAGLISQIIMVQGHLVKADGKTATIKDEKGVMIVPIESVDTAHVTTGQWIRVSVDITAFYRLNPKKFETAASPPGPSDR